MKASSAFRVILGVLFFCFITPLLVWADDFEPDNSLLEAQVITVGNEFQTRDIDPATDVDWMRFGAVQGYGYVIELANESGGDAYFALYDEEEHSLVGNITNFKEWTCPLTGTYYIKVWENGANALADYQVRVLPAYWNGVAVWESDNEPDNVVSRAALSKTDGTVTRIGIDPANDNDWLRFSAKEGNTYTFAISNKSEEIDFRFEVYSDDLTVVSGAQAESWSWMCPQTGTYFVKLYDRYSNQIGAFDFTITGAVIDYAVDIPNPPVTLYMDAVYGTTDYNLIANCSNGSDQLTWASSDPSVVTVDAAGHLQAVGVGTAIITVTCTTDGSTDQVTVMVNADDFEPNDVLADAKPIAVGQFYQHHQLRPNGDPADQYDWMSFEAVGGYGYVIELSDEVGGNVYFRLYNENGNALLGDQNISQVWICPLSGTYYIRCNEYNHDQWVSYNIRVLPAYWNGTAAWGVDHEPDENTYLAREVRTDGTVYHYANLNSADRDWVRFTAKQGTTYTFTLSNESGGTYYFRVCDQVERSLSGNQNTSWVWTCPATGAYYVMLWDYDDNQIGSFDFSISGGEAEYTVDIPQTNVALYSDAAFGETAYNLVATSSNGSDQLTWASSDPSVVTVDAAGHIEAIGVGTAIITVTCTADGSSDQVTVTVNADDFEPNDTLADAKPIAVGQGYQHHQLRPSAPDNIDFISFEAIEGYGYVIELSDEVGGNVYFRLYNENGNLLLGDQNVIQSWTCPLSGTYYIRCHESGSDQWVSYNIRVLPAYWNGTAAWGDDHEPDENTYLAREVRTDGTVYHYANLNSADRDWVRFTAKQGTTYTFTLSNESGGTYYFRVCDQVERSLSGNQNTSWAWSCPASGTYYVLLWDYNDDQVGSFDFSISGGGDDYTVDIRQTDLTLYSDAAYGVTAYNLVATSSNGSGQLTWTSSDPSVVTVDAAGHLQAVGAGTAIITVTCTADGSTDQVTVTVNADDFEPNDVLADAKPIAVGQGYQHHQLRPSAPDNIDELAKSRKTMLFNLDHEVHEEHEAENTVIFFLPSSPSCSSW